MTTEEIKDLEIRVEQNDAAAINELAKALEAGNGITADTKRAMELFEKSAALNYPNAMANLAGRIYETNKPKALDLLTRSGDMGFYGAFIVLADYEKDEDKKLEYMKKAADLGNAQSQYFAGCLYQNKGDMANAIKYWKMGADNNEPECCHNMAIFNMTSEKRNLDEAIKYAEKSFNLGNDKEDLYHYLKLWNLLSTEYQTRKEIRFWTNKKGENGKIFSADVAAASEEMDINDLALLIFEPRNQGEPQPSIGMVIHTELIKCHDFMNALSVWKDYKDGKISLKEVRPSQKAKYMVSIFHALENKLADFE